MTTAETYHKMFSPYFDCVEHVGNSSIVIYGDGHPFNRQVYVTSPVGLDGYRLTFFDEEGDKVKRKNYKTERGAVKAIQDFLK